eukprot:4868743-Karenia_brevis.AAC.1
MPDLSCHASPVHFDDAETSQCGPTTQLEPQHYTDMFGQPNPSCEWPAPVYAPGIWEVDTMKGEAPLTQHDVAIAQATSA